MALRDLSKLPKEELKEFWNSFDTVLADCDGVLWLGNEPIPGSSEALNRLREMGKKIFYVTNNSMKTRRELLEKFKKLNFHAEEEDIISTAYLAACYLKDLGFNKRVYIVGSAAMAEELNAVGIKSFGVGPDNGQVDVLKMARDATLEKGVGAVLVGFDVFISFPKLIKAANYLEDPECLFVATNTDERYPTSLPVIIPGAGTVVKSVTVAAGRDPIIVGKPESYLAKVICKEYGVDPERTIMIGDRCNSDILFGKNCGFRTLLVLSGVTTLDEAIGYQKSKDSEDHKLVADVYLETLGDLNRLLN